MTNEEILYRLSRIHGIHIQSVVKGKEIVTSVTCNYWKNKVHVFPPTHSLEFSIHEANCYFIPQVLKMAGLVIKETLETEV